MVDTVLLRRFETADASLHFKNVGRFRSVRVGRSYRALGVESPDGGVSWFWIGTMPTTTS
jgi:hypothetical protein